MIEHSADLIDRFREGARDGKTPRERRAGKIDEAVVVEFGEQVIYLPLDRKQGPKEKLEAKEITELERLAAK